MKTEFLLFDDELRAHDDVNLGEFEVVGQLGALVEQRHRLYLQRLADGYINVVLDLQASKSPWKTHLMRSRIKGHYLHLDRVDLGEQRGRRGLG
jgi:hypothetical protein